MSQERLEELGPIDYVVLEWPGEQPDAGEVQPLLYGQPQQPTYQEPAPQYAPPPEPQVDMVQQLKDLADLKDQGILTEEEFAAQKARILGG